MSSLLYSPLETAAEDTTVRPAQPGVEVVQVTSSPFNPDNFKCLPQPVARKPCGVWTVFSVLVLDLELELELVVDVVVVVVVVEEEEEEDGEEEEGEVVEVVAVLFGAEVVSPSSP